MDKADRCTGRETIEEMPFAKALGNQCCIDDERLSVQAEWLNNF